MLSNLILWVFPIYESHGPAVLERIMLEEPIDDIWTKEVEDEITVLIDQPKFHGTNVNSIECHDTLCRLRLKHDDASSYEYFKKNGKTMGPLGTDAMGTMKYKDDGSLETAIYFSEREGNPEPFERMMDELDDIVTSMEQN